MKKIISSTLAIIMILLVMVPCSTAFAASTYKVTYKAQFGQSEARKSLAIINEFRTGSDAWYWNSDDTTKTTLKNLSKFTYDYELEKGAMQRAAEVAVMYSHTRPNGGSPFSAYSWSYSCGENIAAGYTTVEDVMEAWKETNDPYSGQGHRRNMLDSGFSGYAIGHVIYKGVHYWAQEFVGKASTASSTTALDGTKAMTIEVSSDNIKNVSLTPSKTTVSVTAGESAALPSVSAILTTNGFWSYTADGVEVTPKGTFSVSDSSVAKIQDGKLYGLKAGTTTLVYSTLGKTAKITVKVSAKTTAPKQATGLKATTVKTTSIALTWSKATGAKYYKLEQSTDGKKWTTVTTTTATSYTVSKLKAGTSYQFRVTAIDSTKKLSAKASSVLKVSTLCSAPTIKLTSTKSKTATVTITKVTGAKSYTIYKSTDNKKWTKVTTTTKTSYTLTSLTAGKKIYVKVQAVNADGKASSYSTVKSVTVKK